MNVDGKNTSAKDWLFWELESWGPLSVNPYTIHAIGLLEGVLNSQTPKTTNTKDDMIYVSQVPSMSRTISFLR